MIPLFAIPAPPLAIGLGFVYLAIGLGCAWRLANQPAATRATAVLAWPVLLPLWFDAPQHKPSGPFGSRIERTIDALRDTLADPTAGGMAAAADLDFLKQALHRADERIALADRLLAEATGAPLAATQGLTSARERAAAEIEAVLAAVVELRLQVGLLALAGNVAPVLERLRELRSRIGALDEVTRLESPA